MSGHTKRPTLNKAGKLDHHSFKMRFKTNPIAKALPQFGAKVVSSIVEYDRSNSKTTLHKLLQQQEDEDYDE